MATMKTPGVYIQEKDAFGNSVVPVPTAVPVFIGYTEKTAFAGQSLVNTPVKISSFADFTAMYGSTPPKVKFNITERPLVSRLKSIAEDIALADAKIADLNAEKEALEEGDDDGVAALDGKIAAAEAAKARIEKQKDHPDVGDVISTWDAYSAARAESADDTGDKKKAFDAAVEDYEMIGTDFASGLMGYLADSATVNYRMFSAMQFFYANGGSDCYIISVGGYDYGAKTLEADEMASAIKFLEKETEPTMVVIPDAVEVIDLNKTELAEKYAGCYSIQSAMMNHCGEFMNRIAILDIPGGYQEKFGEDPVNSFREGSSPSIQKFSSYGAAYYPWLHTNLLSPSNIGSHNVDDNSNAVVLEMLKSEFDEVPGMEMYVNMFNEEEGVIKASLDECESVLGNLSVSYSLMKDAILKKMNLMPPSSAMAGLYTAVDNAEGVWIAPANIAVQNVITPAIKIDHAQQEDLNMPLNGKSICAIRAFTGKGTIVWGGRTLDGNSNDWRYINVRRLMIYLEQSVKEAASAFVFAPNDANTWVSVKSMISNFLTGVWKQGGLVGPSTDAAYSVSVGLGSTMSNDDILNGVMRVTVKVAPSRPAEFIEITFQQKQQQA
jgi:hypothetical protein